MPDIRIKDLSTEQTDLTGFIETDDATLGSRKLNLSQLAARLAARAPLDYIAMDGATANRAAGIYGPFDATVNRRGWIAGVPVLTVLFDFVVPTSNPSVTAIFYAVGGIATTGGANSMRFWLDTAGTLAIAADGSGTSRRFQYVGFRAAYSGQRVRGRVILTNGTTDPVVEVLGTDISSSFAATASATPPDWLSSALDSIFHVVGYNWPAITAPTVIPILGTLTSGAGGEAETWRLDGRLPGWVQAGGSAAALVPSGNAAALGATDSTTLPTVSSQGGGGVTLTAQAGARTGGAGAQVLRIQANGSGSFFATATFAPAANAVLRPLQLRFWARRVVGTFTTFGVGIGSGLTTNITGITGDWAQFEVVGALTSSGTFAFIFPQSGSSSGDQLEIDDLEVLLNGALSIPVVQPCLVVGDGTLIGDNCGRILGGIPVTSRDRWRIAFRTHTSAAENVQLGGGPLFLETNRSRIDSACAVQNSGGALNIAVGSTSGGTNIVASTEIATGSVPTELAPALRYPPTQNLFIRRVAGSGTGPFTITLEGHRVAGNP